MTRGETWDEATRGDPWSEATRGETWDEATRGETWDEATRGEPWDEATRDERAGGWEGIGLCATKERRGRREEGGGSIWPKV